MLFEVWFEQDFGPDDPPAKIGAASARRAAVMFVESRDACSDYAVLAGDSTVVLVRAPDGQVTAWRVSGEETVTYWAESLMRRGG